MENKAHSTPEQIKDFLTYMSNELMRSPLTVMAYRGDLINYIRYITDDHVDDFDPQNITTSDIRIWLALLAKRGRGISTIRRSLQSLRAYFLFLKKTHVIKLDPTAPVELPGRRQISPDFVPSAEMEELIDKIPEDSRTHFVNRRDRLIINLLYTTGMRQSELLNLCDEDVHMSSKKLHIHSAKGRRDRMIPIAPDMVEDIKEYIALRDKQYPDLPADHHMIVHLGKDMSKSKLYTIIKEELARTSGNRRSPHTLRHTFATSMLNGGADLNTVKEFLGHSSLRSTQVYTHVSFNQMKKTYDQAHPRGAGEESGAQE